jgi:hypothetical protein
LPEEIDLLPRPERLRGCAVAEGCPPHSGNGGRREYCGKGELTSDPLLTASTDGEVFLAHWSSLDREFLSWSASGSEAAS